MVKILQQPLEDKGAFDEKRPAGRLYIYDSGSCPQHRLGQYNGCTGGNANGGV
ncbi:hypothetical protein [Bacillus sp. FJAT-27225]|uniref:hypothetical protein n=1 Tax=Bacillus sp. FJAT-27225 TaxID=1743144 RepID=UPI0034A0B66B